MKKMALLFVLLIVNSACAMEFNKGPQRKKAKTEEKKRQRMPLSLVVQAGIKINSKHLLIPSKKREKVLMEELDKLLEVLPYKIDIKTGLYKALQHNNYELVQEWLAYRENKDVNEINISNSLDRPLHIAALFGDEKLLKLLFTNSAEQCLFVTNNNGLTPLQCAVINKNVEAVKYLCSLCQRLNPYGWSSGQSWTPYQFAHNLKFTDIEKILLKSGFPETLLPIDEDKLFFTALNAGATHTVTTMICNNKNIIGREFYNGIDALERASLYGRADIVKLLIAKGAQVNAVKKTKELDALHWAAGGRDVETVLVLLNNGAKINKNSIGGTALHIAAESNDVELINVLLDKGADINKKNQDGLTALHSAKKFKQEEAIKALCDRGAQTEIKEQLKKCQ